MLPKPKHLEPEYGAQFKDKSIVEAYPNRPPYPAAVFQFLGSLIKDEPRTVLDAGCGTGDIARYLVNFVERLDAVDFSEAMLAKAKTLPNGDHPRLSWIYGAVEEAELHPPYALITAGESLHWMQWEVVIPRFKQMLTPQGYLAIVGRNELPVPWADELGKIIPRYTTNKDYQPYDVVAELEKRNLFQTVGEWRSEPVSFIQPIQAYIEAFHSRNGFSRDRMPPEDAAAFDSELKAVLQKSSKAGMIELQVIGTVRWGVPTTI